MQTPEQLKDLVKQKYAEIAGQSKSQNSSSCCGATSSCCGDEVYNIMSEDYTQLEGYNADADLGLGCGLPTEYAHMKEGDTVIDLGSGAGNDCFIARKIVGPSGKVIGVDFTPAMIAKARENAEKLQFHNVEFRQGDIEDLPVTSNMADVIVSNCVLNLVPNKHKVFSEVYRALKPNGHFSISDIVLKGELAPSWKQVAELYAGCVSGAIQQEEYMGIIKEAGFSDIIIQKEKEILLPDDILKQYLTEDDIAAFKASQNKIVSITVFAKKPAKDERGCCEPGSGCC
ncbi:arsenite methyltransferase [Pseudobacter ginsenosidimutans]|uniref:Arsenite methyltransferase n=1 Tax=Pseudobacter ginsenosidimutans TaxID=661488 RepID=A0A4Q7MQR5_9BACT|nr:arsenite methyltransferase [Pseudobacter ginsenosidimutans]QEC42088.1 arsenite methyltransferase [Pseudobacter ginsenosidimutans]RZS71072.1 ubiquinone/menaquinone biosynthesis C-methylase UbiE [Pseudobacter ginsenosidimutans]